MDEDPGETSGAHNITHGSLLWVTTNYVGRFVSVRMSIIVSSCHRKSKPAECSIYEQQQ